MENVRLKLPQPALAKCGKPPCAFIIHSALVMFIAEVCFTLYSFAGAFFLQLYSHIFWNDCSASAGRKQNIFIAAGI